MSTTGERKVVLVTRRTRLEELVARYHTLAQAKFYIEHLGADFSDYLRENAAYAQSLQLTVETLQAWDVIRSSTVPTCRTSCLRQTTSSWRSARTGSWPIR